MFIIDKDLAKAYQLILEYKVFNSTATIDNIKEKLDILMIKSHNSNIIRILKDPIRMKVNMNFKKRVMSIITHHYFIFYTKILESKKIQDVSFFTLNIVLGIYQ